jgi:hypothetical protein
MPTTNPMIQRASLLLPTDEDKLKSENSARESLYDCVVRSGTWPLRSPDFTPSDLFVGKF